MSERILKRITTLRKKKKDYSDAGPLLVELLDPIDSLDENLKELGTYSTPLFSHRVYVNQKTGQSWYDVVLGLQEDMKKAMREASARLTDEFPLTIVREAEFDFPKLVDGLRAQVHVGDLPFDPSYGKDAQALLSDMTELVAFDWLGIGALYALATDERISEIFLDSPDSFVYLDHSDYGRCETRIMMTQRERDAIRTHLDTFKGYTMDYANPSLKNEFDIAGARLRISLDLAPLSVSGFALDVRRLNQSRLFLADLIDRGVLTADAAKYLVDVLNYGGNITIIGQVASGKTSLLNALDLSMGRTFRRVYIEDAVESADLLPAGYHQVKLKVDPFERAGGSQEAERTKEEEIVKVLHRSPDMVILGEIQSDAHSRAFFHALSAGVRGLQTFHASSLEQALRRWREIHGISESSLRDLQVLVQMERPDKTKARRQVKEIAAVGEQISTNGGETILHPLWVREDGQLQRTEEPLPFLKSEEGQKRTIETR